MKLKSAIEFTDNYIIFYIDKKSVKISYNKVILNQLNKIEEFKNYLRINKTKEEK